MIRSYRYLFLLLTGICSIHLFSIRYSEHKVSVHSCQSAHNVLPVRTSREKCIRPHKSLFYSYIYLYKYTSRCMFNPVKGIRFLGTSLNVVRGFPLPVKREAGHQLDRVQHDLDPTDWKPMKTIGQGVREIRIQHEG